MTTDWENLRRARKGDESAWKVLVDHYQKRLIKMTILITKSAAAAQDIVQETFLYLIRSNARHHDGNFRAYISTITYHLALKEKKRLLREDGLENSVLTDKSLHPLDTVLLKERDIQIAGAINSLSEDHRDVLVLRFYGDHSYEEIAGITGQPIGTVKSRIFYAVKKCREKLMQKGVI